ncbi:MAG: outer membrane beta-barrel protein [Lewinellaceae bacterium]|nr:outer membrane beta-barrel protein [Phaeodactylibacter sp.]MCB9039397.1 outer membrane beta-barrel protein [Lewinellaceae bacterium]
MKNALFFLLAFLSAGLQAQDGYFGIAANFGVSRTGTLLSESSTFDNPWAFSGHGGLYWEKEAGSSFRVGATLLFVQVEGYEVRKGQELRFVVPAPGLPSETHLNSEFLYHYSYLALRPYAHLLLNRFYLGLGLQPMWLQAASFKNRQQLILFGQPGKKTESGGGSLQNVNKLDVAPTLEAGVEISPRFRLQATYFRGLAPILIKTGDTKIFNQQATLGLNFCLTCTSGKVVKGPGG